MSSIARVFGKTRVLLPVIHPRGTFASEQLMLLMAGTRRPWHASPEIVALVERALVRVGRPNANELLEQIEALLHA